MDALSYFAAQSQFTDPGAYSGLYADLPKTVEELCGVVQGLCLDFEERYKYPIVNERLLETNSRYVERVIGRIVAMDKKDPKPLTAKRDIVNHFLATSSDYANIFCSMARAQGYSARKRVGFVALADGSFRSHDVVEYWDVSAKCWKTVAPSGCSLDKYMTASEAWQAVRGGKMAAETFRNDEHKGFEVVLENLILDFAAMNKRELLNWDRYGWMTRPVSDFSDKAWQVLDHVAELLKTGDAALEEIQTIYDQEEGLQVPRVIFCDSSVTPPHKVDLTK